MSFRHRLSQKLWSLTFPSVIRVLGFYHFHVVALICSNQHPGPLAPSGSALCFWASSSAGGLTYQNILTKLEQREKKKGNPRWRLVCRLSSHLPRSRSSLYVIVKDKEFCDADFSFCPSESGSQRSVLLHYLYLKWNPLYPGLFPVWSPFDHL